MLGSMKWMFTYAALAACVKGFGPGLHDEGVVDGDDVDFAGVFEFLGVDVFGDVLGGASRAYHHVRSCVAILNLPC